MRYRLLETVAEYAGERLDEAGDRPEAERAHLTYYRELARTTDPLLRGPGQLAALDVFQREYENIRTALRHAVAARDEQEALCLVLSLSWYWQMRDLRIAGPQLVPRGHARSAPTPSPLPDPPRPAGLRALHGHPAAHGAASSSRRPDAASTSSISPPWTWSWSLADTGGPAEAARHHRGLPSPALPQTCRYPGLLWFFAVMLTGDMERLSVIVGETVRTCRERHPATSGSSPPALQMRANVLANRTDWAGDATRDADESLEIFRRLGDAWGAAEALSARGEAHERKAEYAAAADGLPGRDRATPNNSAPAPR